MAFVRSPDNVSVELLQEERRCRRRNLGQAWETPDTGDPVPPELAKPQQFRPHAETRGRRLTSKQAVARLGVSQMGTMAIKAHAINGSDPGRYPAAPPPWTSLYRWDNVGPKQDRRTRKGVSFRPVGYRRYRSERHNCQRQSCSGGSRCVSSAGRTGIQSGALSKRRRGLQAPGNRSLRFAFPNPTT